MKVDPANVREGARKIDGAHTDVSKLSPPDSGGAAAGLQGFVTAGVLPAAHDGVKASLGVVAGRYDETGQLLRRAADTFEHQDKNTAVTLSQLGAAALQSLGDLNSAT